MLKQLKRITGTQSEILIADRRYRGEKDNGKTPLLAPSRPSTADTEYKKRKQRKSFRKRAGIETTISHLKQDYRLVRCFLKGEIGDQINISLSSAVYKLKWIQFRLELFLTSFTHHSKTCSTGKSNMIQFLIYQKLFC